MSAYICDPATPDTLAAAASDELIEETLRAIYPTGEEPDKNKARGLVARYLVVMNVRSVQYRYHGESVETLPGYCYKAWESGTTYYPMPTADEHPYIPTPLGQQARNRDYVGPDPSLAAGAGRVAAIRRVLGVARGWEYQACELPEYKNSAAAEFIRALTLELAEALAEGWTMDDEKHVELIKMLAERNRRTVPA